MTLDAQERLAYSSIGPDEGVNLVRLPGRIVRRVLDFFGEDPPTDIPNLAGSYVAQGVPEMVVRSSSYAVDPTGVADSTAGLVAAAASGTKRLILPEGTYKLSAGSLTLPAGTILEMYGAKLQASSAGTLVALAGPAEIHGGEIQGFGTAAAYNDAERLVSMVGTVGARKAHALLKDLYLHGSAGYLVYAAFVDDLEMANLRGYDCAYTGVAGLSVTEMWLNDSDVDMNTPVGSGGQAYGVFFSRTQGTLVAQPRSTDSGVRGTKVKNVPIWEGLDTHAGQRIKFIDVTVLNCKKGVVFGSSKDETAADAFAPHACVVDGYAIDSTVTDGTREDGIFVGGVLGGEKARGCVVGEGSIIGHGDQTVAAASAGIDARDTVGLKISGASVIECSPTSVLLRGDNRGFLVEFVSIDPWTDTGAVGAAYHLRIAGSNNRGHLGAHSFDVNSKAAQYVSDRGLGVDNLAGNEVTMGDGFMATTGTTAGAPAAMTKIIDTGDKITTPLRQRLLVGTAALAVTPIRNILVKTAVWDPGSLANGASEVVAMGSFTGAAVGDPCVASLDTIGNNSVLLSAHVRQAGVVTVTLENRTGGVLDIASGTLRVIVFNFS